MWGGLSGHCSAALGQWLEPRYLLRHLENVCSKNSKHVMQKALEQLVEAQEAGDKHFKTISKT